MRWHKKYLLTGIMWLVFASTLDAAGFDHDHKAWDELLQTYVVDKGESSQVNYALLKQQDQVKLNGYLQSLSAVSKTQFAQWSKPQRLAFLINAYNAFTVKLIIDNYPLKSIKDIGNIFRSTWKIKFFNLLGENTYLDYIEHELIRGNRDYSEPRIHFALVCASVGCPKLQPQAFTAVRLEDMLESGAQAFLTDRSRNHYNAKGNTLELSSIFKWYGEDFRQTSGTVARYVAPYLSSDPAVRQEIASDNIEIEYLDYDWSLNDVTAVSPQ